MKLLVTKKDIKNSGAKIIAIGYCEAQNLLKYSYAFAYSKGVYGWACDYYAFDNIIISTGYSPIGDRIDYDLLKKYEEKAAKINHNLSYDKKMAKIRLLLLKLLRELEA